MKGTEVGLRSSFSGQSHLSSDSWEKKEACAWLYMLSKCLERYTQKHVISDYLLGVETEASGGGGRGALTFYFVLSKCEKFLSGVTFTILYCLVKNEQRKDSPPPAPTIPLRERQEGENRSSQSQPLGYGSSQGP